jgi:hypothetical protein
MPVPPNPARHRLPTAVLVVSGVLVIAACGGSVNPTSTSKNTLGRQTSGVPFSRCMRSHGVPNFPDPSASGPFQAQVSGAHTRVVLSDIPGVNPDSPAFKTAQSTCQNLLPGAFGPSLESSAGAMAQARVWAKCMRAHGVPSFPDPTTTAPTHRGAAFNGLVNTINGAYFALPAATINPDSPAFQHAAKACQLPG